MSLDVVIAGIGLWSPQLPGWTASQAILRGEVAVGPACAARPSPALLAANERRRAPDSVLLALEVAGQACAMTPCRPGDLPAIFASAYGDLAINDYLCATLAQAPQDLSPTRFHNSVHNAPAGYWAIATGCMASTNALSAGAASFGAGLLEAALLVHDESTPVVFAAYDVPAAGALTSVIANRSAFAAAFVLAPVTMMAGATLHVDVHDAVPSALAPPAPLLQSLYVGNPAAAALPLLAALASGRAGSLALAAGPRLTLHLEISIWQK